MERGKQKKKNEIAIRSSTAEYLTYIAVAGDKADGVEMRYEDENIWLTQKMMATLYEVDVRTINYHIKKIFADSELQEVSVIRKFRITAEDGKLHMGLTTWAAAPEGKIIKSDVSVAKNYLSDKEMRSLERIVSVYLDLAEDRAERHISMIIEDWSKRQQDRMKSPVRRIHKVKTASNIKETYFDEELEFMRDNCTDLRDLAICFWAKTNCLDPIRETLQDFSYGSSR